MPLPQYNDNSKSQTASVGKKNKSPFVKALINSGFLFLYSIAFNLFAWFFIGNNVAWYVKILVGIAFLLPAMIISSARGRAIGEKEFKSKNNAILTDVHSHGYVEVSKGIPFLYVAPFVVIAILICFIGIVAKFQFLQGLSTFLFMSGTLIYMGLGLLPKINVISWCALLAVATVVLFQSAAFIFGYFRGIASIKKSNKELVSEIRSFD